MLKLEDKRDRQFLSVPRRLCKYLTFQFVISCPYVPCMEPRRNSKGFMKITSMIVFHSMSISTESSI